MLNVLMNKKKKQAGLSPWVLFAHFYSMFYNISVMVMFNFLTFLTFLCFSYFTFLFSLFFVSLLSLCYLVVLCNHAAFSCIFKTQISQKYKIEDKGIKHCKTHLKDKHMCTVESVVVRITQYPASRKQTSKGRKKTQKNEKFYSTYY